jgi:hypothetical protein
MILIAAIIVVVCFACVVFHYWNPLLGAESKLGLAPFAPWVGFGLVVPALAWLFLNSGLFRIFPPLIPAIATARSAGGAWAALFFSLPAPGLLVIGSYWAAISFLQMATIITLHAEPRSEWAVVVIGLGIFLTPLAAWLGYRGGWTWAGIALLLWLIPVTHCTISLACRPIPRPFYARAIARLKLGKYQEAEREVIHELEKCEQDFEGWMLLAEMYANQFGDLAEADRTISAVCAQPNVTPLQISLAFHRLADWHLKPGEDPLAAARALDQICSRLPGSHFAKMASLRRDQLPRSRQELLEQRVPKKLRLPALTGDFDEQGAGSHGQLTRPDALRLVNECVDRLKTNPNETASREKLAILFAEELGKADLAIEQLDLLLGMPRQAESKRAEWLSREAAWQLRYRKDRVAAKATLERLIHEHPQSAQAFAAQRWLNLLAMEQRAQTVLAAGTASPNA